MLKGHQNIFGHFQQCLEVFGKSSKIFGSHWDIFGNENLMHLTHLKKLSGIKCMYAALVGFVIK